jgi:hypothetical protein
MRHGRLLAGTLATTLGLVALAMVEDAPVAAAVSSECLTANGVDVTCTFVGSRGSSSSSSLTIPDGVAAAHLHVVGTAGQDAKTGTGTVLGGMPGGRPAVIDADIATSAGDQLVVEFRDNGGIGHFAGPDDSGAPYAPASGSGGGSSVVRRAAGQSSQLIAEAGGGGGAGLTPPDQTSAAGSVGGNAGASGQRGATEGTAVVPAAGGQPGLPAMDGHVATDGLGGAGATVDEGTPAQQTFAGGSPGSDGYGGNSAPGDFTGGGGGGGTTAGGAGGTGGTGISGRAYGAGGGGGSSTVPAGGTLAVSPDESALVRITFSIDMRSSYSPTSIDFGPTALHNSSSSRTVTLSNDGPSTLRVGFTTLVEDPYNSFVVNSDGCASRTLAVGATCQVAVSFRPQVHGDASAQLRLTDASPTSPHVVALHGFGTRPVASVSPTGLDFGTREIGRSGPSQVATLVNTGDADLHVTSVWTNGDFQIGEDGCGHRTVAPGASCTVAVAFLPRTSGVLDGQLGLAHDAGSTSYVSLRGIGTPPADLKLLGVGSAYTGRDHLVTRTVSASGKVQAYPLVILNEDTTAHSYRIHLDAAGFPSTSDVRNGVTGAVLPTSAPGTYTTATVQPGKTVSYSLRVTPTGVGLGTSRVGVTLQSDIGATIESLTTETNTAAPANGTSPFELFAKQGTQAFIGGPTAGQTTTGPALNVGSAASYTVRLKNNGTTKQQIGLRLTDIDGCAGAFSVSVTAAGKVRTVDAYAGTFLTPLLGPGGYQDVQVSIRRAAVGCGSRLVRAQSLGNGSVVRTSYLLANAAYDAATD